MNTYGAVTFFFWKKGYNWYYLGLIPELSLEFVNLRLNKENVSKIRTLFWDKNSGPPFLVYIETGSIYKLQNNFMFPDSLFDIMTSISVLFILLYITFLNLSGIPIVVGQKNPPQKCYNWVFLQKMTARSGKTCLILRITNTKLQNSLYFVSLVARDGL